MYLHNGHVQMSNVGRCKLAKHDSLLKSLRSENHTPRFHLLKFSKKCPQNLFLANRFWT